MYSLETLKNFDGNDTVGKQQEEDFQHGPLIGRIKVPGEENFEEIVVPRKDNKLYVQVVKVLGILNLNLTLKLFVLGTEGKTFNIQGKVN